MYPGGTLIWERYVSKNLKYPDRASIKSIQGTVIVCFTVDESGNTNDYSIIMSVEYSLDQEAIPVIKNSYLWIPAHNGKMINV